ncbi:MAG: peptide chain release factor 2 [Planctomycetes bacterium]|nr:peptide chain release factor 2 [Planctomycetota bacterium]
MGEHASRIAELLDTYRELYAALSVDDLLAERKKLEAKMGALGFWDNQEAAQLVVADLKSVKAETDAFTSVAGKIDDLEVLDELAEAPDELADLNRELALAEEAISGLRLRAYFTGEHDALSAYLALQAGAGGIDACDWTEMVMRMLTRYAERCEFEVEILELDKEPTAGIRSATLHVKGRGAFGWLKSERGTHRLVRVSPFDAQNRRQTAFCAVDITPEFDDSIEVEIKDSDLKTDFYRAGGAGGQHVNKTSSAVRITHLPSGIVVQCQNERHQFANRRTAMQMLKNRLYQQELEKRAVAASLGYANKSNMGFGASDRIRTYTLQPFQLAKDTRTGHEDANIQHILDGDLHGFVEAYLRWAAAEREKAK